ncbi:MAG: hypothetical protein EOO71_15550 [Myxococcaceae bacterium]|nr:MAG: hypothetical protein EOO71_15550 [Myxococcaceae bacterium]
MPYASAALFDAQSREPHDVVIGNSPMVDGGRTYHHGLTAWLECDTPSSGCAVVSSPGAFGFTPWVDRDGGSYAIPGMQLEATNEERVGAFSVELEQQLRPELRAAVAPAP